MYRPPSTTRRKRRSLPARGRQRRRSARADPAGDLAVYRDLFAPTGAKLYTGRPPRFVTGQDDRFGAVAGAVAVLRAVRHAWRGAADPGAGPAGDRGGRAVL